MDAFLYCLAYAASKTGVEIYAVVVMGNHYHIVVRDPDGVIPVFAECLNKLVAKCMNAMRGRWENFWASEPVSYVRLLDDDAIVREIAYTLCNPVQGGLVECGDDWPGLRLGRSGTYQVQRPAKFFREQGVMPECVALEVKTPPLQGMSGAEAQHHIDQVVKAREAAERTRIRDAGRKFLGPRVVIEQDPFASPLTHEKRRGLSPRLAGLNKWLRIEAVAQSAEFVRQYREALSRWCNNVREVLFPVGTYLMRVRHFVRCAQA